jgi:hypothetical protein
VLRSAITRFSVTVHDLHRLLSQARHEQQNRRPPDDLKELAHAISLRHSASIIKRIEWAADDAYDDATGYLESLAKTAPDEDTVAMHPIALEQLVALLTVSAPPKQVAEASRRVAAVSKEDSDGMHYALLYLQWKHAPPLTTRLGNALVPTLTASFEEMLGAIFRLRLTAYPGEIGKRMIKMETLDRYASKEDLKRKAIDDKVRELIQKTPSDWIVRIQGDTQLDATALGIDWGRVIEVFARRDLLVHTGGRVDERYLQRTRSPDVRLGQILMCDEDYFDTAAELLSEAAQILAVAYLVKLTRTDPAPADLASTLLLHYLEQKQWDEALRLAEMVVKGRDVESISPEVRVNWWMARREARDGVEGIHAEVSVWHPPNDDRRYRLAKAALLFDDNSVRRILQERSTGRQSFGPTVADWPLVVAMRERRPNLQQLLVARAPLRAARRRKERP